MSESLAQVFEDMCDELDVPPLFRQRAREMFLPRLRESVAPLPAGHVTDEPRYKRVHEVLARRPGTPVPGWELARVCSVITRAISEARKFLNVDIRAVWPNSKRRPHAAKAYYVLLRPGQSVPEGWHELFSRGRPIDVCKRRETGDGTGGHADEACQEGRESDGPGDRDGLFDTARPDLNQTAGTGN